MKQNKIPRNEYIIKPKGKTNPYKDDVVYSNLGQWKYPGQVTKIPSNQITMQGVNYPVHGIDDTGYSQMMYPGMDYTFPGEYVTEYPMARYGGGLPRAQNGIAQTPEEWGKEIRNVEHQIGNPSTWTLDSHKMLQDKLNEYKSWRENTPEGKAVIDYHNEPNEYVVPLPPHLQTVPKKPFGGIHTKTDTHMANGGWLDTMQKGGRAPIYVNDPNDPLLQLYNDSLSIHNQAKKSWHYGDTRVSKDEFTRKDKEQGSWPQYTFAEKKYKRDKKAGNFKNFEDYVLNLTSDKMHDPAFEATYLRDIFDPAENGYSKQGEEIKEKMPNGKIRTYFGYKNGKPDKSAFEEFNPVTHTSTLFSNSDGKLEQLSVSNPHMKPTSSDYWAYKTKYPTNKISLSSLNENSRNGKLVFRNKSAKEYQNYTWGTTENPQYKAPVQPVIYMPKKYNPNDPRLAEGKKVFESTFNKPLPKKVIKKPVDTPKKLPKKDEVITPEHLPMIQASMPTMISQEPDITPNFIYPKQSNVNDRIGWRMDSDTRKMVPVYLESAKQKVKEGKRLYNKEIPTGTMETPKDFEAQFDRPESSEKTDPYWRKEYVNPKTAVIKKEYGGGWLDEFAPGGEKIKISDKRTTRQTTGKAINPNKDLKTGSYDKAIIDSLAENATRRGVNPYQAIAMSLIESKLGKTDSNVGHVSKFKASVSPYKQMMDEILKSQSVARRLNKTDPASIIQAYNGYGKLFPSTEKGYHGFEASSFYGVPVDKKGLSMKENPLYGKEVLDIQKNIIEKDPNIKNIVNSYQYPRIKGYAKDWNDFLPHIEVAPKELTEEDLNRENMKAFLESTGRLKKGGQKGLKSFTSKNVYTSINDIMLRNETLFGPAGKKRFKPSSKYKDGGWLDNMY